MDCFKEEISSSGKPYYRNKITNDTQWGFKTYHKTKKALPKGWVRLNLDGKPFYKYISNKKEELTNSSYAYSPNSAATLQYATETTVPSSSIKSAREIADLRNVFRHQITGLRYNEKEPDILMPPDREPAFTEVTNSAISLFFSGFSNQLDQSDEFFVNRQYKILLLEVMNPINKRLFNSEFANNIFDEKEEDEKDKRRRARNWFIDKIEFMKPDDQVGIRLKIYMYRYSYMSPSPEEAKHLTISKITEIINKELNYTIREIKERLSILLDNVDDILHDIEEKTDSEKKQYEMFRMWEEYVYIHDIQEEYDYTKHYKIFSTWRDEQNDDRFRVSWIDDINKSCPICRRIASALEYNRLNPPRSCPECGFVISGNISYCKNCKKIEEERAKRLEYIRLQERAELLKLATEKKEMERKKSIIQQANIIYQQTLARPPERIDPFNGQKCSFWQPGDH